MIVSVEWRGFRRWAHDDIQQLALAFARRLELVPPGNVMDEADTYLIAPGMRHNLKLRRGALELKQRRPYRRAGWTQWLDKVVLTFPLLDEAVRLVWVAITGRQPRGLQAFATCEELIAGLTHTDSRLLVVPVSKRRLRLDDGHARLEIADLVLPNGERFVSVCADGYEVDAVEILVERACLRAGFRPLGYVDFLQEAAWWLPDIDRKRDVVY
jgi:hypothetical protein